MFGNGRWRSAGVLYHPNTAASREEEEDDDDDAHGDDDDGDDEDDEYEDVFDGDILGDDDWWGEAQHGFA